MLVKKIAGRRAWQEGRDAEERGMATWSMVTENISPGSGDTKKGGSTKNGDDFHMHTMNAIAVNHCFI